MTTAETIAFHTKKHLLENNGLLLGQCVTAVGWVGGTVPPLTEADGIIELPTCDVAGPGFAVGAALSGRRPIFLCRYQGFMWYNAAALVNYAAKSKEIWKMPCPVFVRAIGMEHNGIGPVASSCQHGMFLRMPGIPIYAPMTPKEWEEIWNWFLCHDDPVYVSEHRRGFTIDYEMVDQIIPQANVTILAVSAARLNALESVKILQERGILCNLFHIKWLKPFYISDLLLRSLSESKFGIVVDSDFELGGFARSAAYDLMLRSGKKVFALGLKDKTCGVASFVENCTPSGQEIADFCMNLIL